jgi:hypothetical protein
VFPVRYVARKVLVRAQQAQAQLGSISSQLTENLSASREIRAFGLEQRFIDRFATTARTLLTAQLKIAKYSLGLNPIIEIISAVGIAMTLVYSYRAGLKFEVLMGVLVALYQCYEPIKKLGYLNSELKRGTAALERLEPILNEPLAITDPMDAPTVSRLRGDIAFNDVTFAYGDTPTLSEIAVTIRPARCARLSAQREPARAHSPTSCRDSTMSVPAASPSTTSTCAPSSSLTYGGTLPSFPKSPFCSTIRFITTSALAAKTPPARKSSPPRSPPTRMNSSATNPKATTRS